MQKNLVSILYEIKSIRTEKIWFVIEGFFEFLYKNKFH